MASGPAQRSRIERGHPIAESGSRSINRKVVLLMAVQLKGAMRPHHMGGGISLCRNSWSMHNENYGEAQG